MKISAVFGTRPEAIKFAPVILALRGRAGVQCRLCVTGQHRHMLDQILATFSLVPDVDLNLMEPNQTLTRLTARAMDAIGIYLSQDKPDMVMVQGDTTTTFCAALAAFYHHIPVAHIEAGLRTGNLEAPWPEEANRLLTTRLTTLHFAPTNTARDNLLREGVPAQSIHVTGNTVIDALLLALERVRLEPPAVPELPGFLQPNPAVTDGPRMVLITGHRRESFGAGFESICRAIATLAARFPDVHFVYPVHLNPNVREPVQRILGAARQTHRNLHLIAPLSYLTFVALLARSHLVLTDSGGVQEEAPTLGKPVLVMRETTERPEAIEAGTVRLVGTQFDEIVSGVAELLLDDVTYAAMSRAHNPYGDGLAAGRIVNACDTYCRGPAAGPVPPESVCVA